MLNKQSIYSIARSLFGSLQFFLLSMLVIQFTSLDNWGAFINIYLIWSLLVLLINSGSKEYLLKVMSAQPALKWQFLSSNTAMRLLFGLPFVLILFFIPSVSVAEKMMMFTAIFLRVLTSGFDGLITFEKEFVKAFIVELLSFIIVIFLFCVGYRFADINPTMILFCIVIGDFVKVFLYEIAFRLFRNFKVQVDMLKSGFYLALPYAASGLIGLVISKADLYLFGLFSVGDNEVVGQYHILNTFSNLLMVVVSALLQTRSKVLFRIQFSKYKTVRDIYVGYSTLIIVVATVVFYFLSPVMFNFTPGILHLLIILATAIFFSSYYLYFYLLTRMSNLNLINKVLLAAGVINIVLCFLLIPLYSIEGALLSPLVANIFILLCVHYKSKRYVG